MSIIKVTSDNSIAWTELCKELWQHHAYVPLNV